MFIISLEVIIPFGVNYISYLGQLEETPDELEEIKKRKLILRTPPKVWNGSIFGFWRSFETMFSRYSGKTDVITLKKRPA